jgi:hypothetical protein
MFLEVKQAKYLNDYKIKVEFNNGVTKTIDLDGQLDGEIFEPLKNIEHFKNFSIKFNTIEWSNGADFAPEFLYGIGKENK